MTYLILALCTTFAFVLVWVVQVVKALLNIGILNDPNISNILGENLAWFQGTYRWVCMWGYQWLCEREQKSDADGVINQAHVAAALAILENPLAAL